MKRPILILVVLLGLASMAQTPSGPATVMADPDGSLRTIRGGVLINVKPTKGKVDAGAIYGARRIVSNAGTAITSTDYLIAHRGTTAARTDTLPAASTVASSGALRVYLVKDETGNAASFPITVQRTGSDTIDGQTSVVLNVNFGVLALYSAGGTEWFTGHTIVGGSIGALLDQISTAAGTILYRGATSWSALAPGTAGQVLSTNGTSPPTWINNPAGGNGDIAATLVNATRAASADDTAVINRWQHYTPTSADMQATLPAASGNTDKALGISIDATATKLVTVSSPITAAGDTGARMSAWKFAGANLTNTNAGVIYWKIASTTVSIYKDSAGSNLVAQGAVSGGSATLAIKNNSGLSGSVSVTGSGDDTDVSNNTLTWNALIDGWPERVMWTGETALLRSNGTNWRKEAGKTIPMTCTMQRNTVSAAIANSTFTKVLLNVIPSGADIGTLGDTINNRFNIRRSGLYTVTHAVSITGGGGASEPVGMALISVPYYGGPDVTPAATFRGIQATAASTGATLSAGGAQSWALNAGSTLELYTYQDSGNSSVWTTTASADRLPYLTATEQYQW